MSDLLYLVHFIFTFQSGSIQICSFTLSSINSICFTFQSGSIQITIKTWYLTKYLTLHSNLVLFKSSQCRENGIFIYPLHSNLVLFKLTLFVSGQNREMLYIPIWFYSNEVAPALAPPSTYFTFQSGSIQISPPGNNIFAKSLLYIPIWFYSNGSNGNNELGCYHLYIPIWFYSNGCGVIF